MIEQRETGVKSWRVGFCHHGYRAYTMTTSDPKQKEVTRGRWHSGPPTSRRAAIDRAAIADGIKLARCEGKDPWA